LDPVTRLELQDEFIKLKTTAIFVTHDLREAMRIGTRIVLFANGLVDWAAPAQEFRHADTEEARAFLKTYA